MIKDLINTALQNKNALMFITALIFMSGILAFFNDNALTCAIIISLISIFAILKNYIPTKYIILWIFVFYFGFFNSLFKLHSTDSLAKFAPSTGKIQGQIVSVPNGNKDKIKFFFKADKYNEENVVGKTLVTLSVEDTSKIKIGGSYEMKGYLKTPFKAGNPSQFDYGKYLRNFDTFTVFYSKEINPIETEISSRLKILQNLNDLRNNIVNVHSRYLKSPNLEILGGIVFGDDAVAPPEHIRASFINSGLLHILAASGMNVAFIYGFWIFFMRRIRAPFKFSVISGMGLIILYTMMTGLGASVIRASLMLLFVLVGKLIDRDAHSVSLLAFVAMLMLIYNPAFINDVGFQLSFIVTFGILTTANVIFEKFKDQKVLSWILNIILIPVVAQIWVAPIQMFYFNTFCVYSIFANVLSMPFLSVISFGGFISSIFAIFTPFTNNVCFAFDFILNYILNILVFISNFFASLPFSIITTTHPNIWQIFIYYGIILVLTLSIKQGFNKKLVITCLSGLIILGLTVISIPNNKLEIITFDVQNADCFLIKTPSNKYFVIDTGRAGYNGSKAQANSIIIKYLKDRGIKDIEGLIISHFDNDHSGGAVDIMKSMNVKQVYLNTYSDKSMTSFDIYKTLKENKIPSLIPFNNTNIYSEPNLDIKTFMTNSDKDNEKSIIALLSYGDFDMLFTGDAGVEAFSKIKEYIPHNIEVLKVGHHGGPNVVNSEMLNHMNTKVSIISTGPNSFGHPNRGTLDILRNTDIYRTDRHNSIKITSDGNEYKVFIYRPDKKKYIQSKISKTNI